jgi:protein-S-isoprenylcysteine O-methyltransferase Ste14
MPEREIVFRIDEPVVLVGTAALLLWLCGERLLQLLGFHQPKAERRDPFLWYCWHVPAFYGALVFSLLDAAMWHWTVVGPALGFVRWVGVPLVAVGIAIRLLSRLALGKQFSPHVQTTPEHRLVTTGIYRSIRHPAYLGYVCLLLGIPLCFGSVAGFACGLAAVATILYRIRIEEAALAGWFADEYRRYQARTHKLIPGLW